MAVLSPYNVQPSSYIEMLENFRKRRDEWTQLFPAMDQLRSLFPQLQASAKCVSVGAGLAQYDSEFINRCMPNIESVQVIEADPTCAGFLRKNLASMLRSGSGSGSGSSGKDDDAENTNFGDQRPKIDIYEGLVQDWNNSLNDSTYLKADVLIAFHLFYYLGVEERKRFYADCFGRWLKPGGLAVFVLIADRDRTNMFQNLYRELNLPAQVEIEEIKNELRASNLDVAHSRSYSCVMDLGDLDQQCLQYIQANAAAPRSQRQILDAIDKVSQDGSGKETYIAELIVVREKTGN